MVKEITDKLNVCLKRMNSMLDWQFGMAFKYFENRAGLELNKLEIIEDSRYNYFKVKYDSLIRRAKDIGLI